MARLSDPVTILKGIGPTKAKQFAALNIFTLGDLICHFPRGYEDRTKLVPIEKLEPDQPACFRAMVMNSPRTAHVRKGLDITAKIEDPVKSCPSCGKKLIYEGSAVSNDAKGSV